MNRRKRILFLAEGITMTHFVRPAALAEALPPDEFDVYFCTPARYHRLLRSNFRRVAPLWTRDPHEFLAALARGRVLYPTGILRRYVQDDLRLFSEVRPDLVIGDFRLSLCISARVAGIPFASVFNAQWSPLHAQPAIAPETPLSNYLSPRLLNWIFAALRPALFALHARPVNTIRGEYGLPALPHSLGAQYTSGDLTLYPDVPEFVPLGALPPNHHYVGTCPYTLHCARPDWWDTVMRSRQSKVFVSLGSSGPVKALPAILAALSRLPVKVLVATSGRALGNLPANVYAAELLPYEETAARCAFVVSHGGTGGLYPTLAAGVPMLAVPANLDNHLSAALLERSGAGLSVRVEWAAPRTLQSAMLRLLFERSFTTSARLWAARIAQYDTRTLIPRILRDWFASGTRATSATRAPATTLTEACMPTT